ncbi:MAG TPA: hypothetical protein VJ201_05160 [Candidatus Babeliales bacterium]|nr:hypothetical protein [Candidatus Babeliales bacterium]HLC07339.1 hypothetical protein [Candidatus Babeliales bacterium]
MTLQKPYLLSFLLLVFPIKAETSKPQCTGKVAKERLPLFVRADEIEQYFMEALTECQKNGSCKTCPIFEQATHATAICLISLADHLVTLEQGKEGVCNRCERTETKDLKERFIELLKTKEALQILPALAENASVSK